MIRFIVEKAPVTKTSAKGNPYKVQEAWVQLMSEDGTQERFPRRTELLFRASETGYEPGEYVLAPQSMRVGQYDRLELGRVVLSPVAASGATKPGAR